VPFCSGFLRKVRTKEKESPSASLVYTLVYKSPPFPGPNSWDLGWLLIFCGARKSNLAISFIKRAKFAQSCASAVLFGIFKKSPDERKGVPISIAPIYSRLQIPPISRSELMGFGVAFNFLRSPKVEFGHLPCKNPSYRALSIWGCIDRKIRPQNAQITCFPPLCD